ncbi:hypothetical protein C8R46DRAFT_1356553 [Mycena filopes]|nr:hypothetical protein C8R46DRAFT_1356553 [Mycena filopes]
MSPRLTSLLVLGALLVLSNVASAAPELLTVIAPDGGVFGEDPQTVVLLGVNSEGVTTYGGVDVVQSVSTIDGTLLIASNFFSATMDGNNAVCTAVNGDSVCNLVRASDSNGPAATTTLTAFGLNTLIFDVVSTSAPASLASNTAPASSDTAKTSSSPGTPETSGKPDSASVARVATPLLGALMGLLTYHLA